MNKAKDTYLEEREFINEISEGYFEDNVLDAEMNALFSKAYALATEVHKNQKRDDGAPYITHIDALINILKTEISIIIGIPALITAALHDVLEDSEDINYDYLVAEFDSEIAEEVKLLTKTKDLSMADYLSNMEAYEYPRTLLHIKLADRLHNVRSLKLIRNTKPDKVKRYIEETIAYYVPLSKKHNILSDHLKKALDELND